MGKWWEVVVVSRKAMKALKMWVSRSMGRAWNVWLAMMVEVKRLRGLAAKCMGRLMHRVQTRAWLMWEERVRTARRLRVLAGRAIGRWRNRALAEAWNVWCEAHGESKRLRGLGSKVALRWAQQTLWKGLEKWWHEVVRARKAQKVLLMWTNHVTSRAWRQWVLYVEDRKRLRALSGRVVRRWRRRALSRAWECWYEYHIQTALEAEDNREKDIENKETERLRRMMERMAMKRGMNASTRRAWQSWHDDHLDRMKSSPGQCQLCGRFRDGVRQVWDDSLFASHFKSDGTWVKALDEHARMERELCAEHLDWQRQVEIEMADTQRRTDEFQLNANYAKNLGTLSLPLSQTKGLEVSAAPPRSQYRSMSTLGFKYNTSTLKVESLDIMGPAFQDGRVRMHDQLLAVDEKAVDEENVESLLRGKDIPGSSVLLTLFDSETAQVKHVQLTRMATVMILEGSLGVLNVEKRFNYNNSLGSYTTTPQGEGRMIM
jgi:hypothetical protein